MLGEEGETNLRIIPVNDSIQGPVRVVSDGLTAYINEKKLDAGKYPCFRYDMKGGSDCFIWAIVPVRKKAEIPSILPIPVVANGKRADDHDASAVEIRIGGVTETVCVYHRTYDAELMYGTYREWGLVAYHSPDVNVVHGVKDGAVISK